MVAQAGDVIFCRGWYAKLVETPKNSSSGCLMAKGHGWIKSRKSFSKKPTDLILSFDGQHSYEVLKKEEIDRLGE